MILRRNKSKVWKETYKQVQGKLNTMLDQLDDLGYVIGDLNNEVMCESDCALIFHNSRKQNETILKSVDDRIFYSLKEYERSFCEEFSDMNLHYIANLNIFWELETATKNNDAMKFLKVMQDKREFLLNKKRRGVGYSIGNMEHLSKKDLALLEEKEVMHLSTLEHMITSFENAINTVYDEVSELINTLHEYAKLVDDHVIEFDEFVNV